METRSKTNSGIFHRKQKKPKKPDKISRPTPRRFSCRVYYVGRRGKPSTWLPRPKLAEERIRIWHVYEISDFLEKYCSFHDYFARFQFFVFFFSGGVSTRFIFCCVLPVFYLFFSKRITRRGRQTVNPVTAREDS